MLPVEDDEKSYFSLALRVSQEDFLQRMLAFPYRISLKVFV